MGYRDAVKQARAELDEAREALRDRESKLSQEDEAELPDGLRARLSELRTKLEPAADTIDAIRDAERALDKYRRALTESVDLLAQVRGAKARGEDVRPRGPGRARRILGRAALSGVVLAMLLWTPGWLVEHADEAAQACIVDHDARDEPIHGGCAQGHWLWPAAAFAWERDAAVDMMADIERRSFDHDVAHAAAGRPNRDARDDMAEQVLAHEAWTPQRRVETVFRMGAFEVLAASDLAEAGPEGFFAARAVADVERANTLASNGGPGATAELDLRRGAWLCLMGDASRGREILVGALADEARRQLREDELAEAAFACAPERGDEGIGALLRYERRRDLAFLDPAWQVGRRVGIARGWLDQTDGQSGIHRLAPVALMVLHAGLSESEVLALVAPAAPGEERGLATSAILFPDVEALFTRWSPLRLTQTPVPIEPLLQAADRLVAMSASVGARAEGEHADADSEPDSPPSVLNERIAWSAREDPAAALRRAAWAMRLQVAVELSRRGAHDEVLDLLGRADAVAPPRFAWLSAGLRHASGDPEGAVASLEAFIAGDEYAELEISDRATLRLELALALASLGRWKAATEIALDVYELTTKEELEVALGPQPRWLYAALALRTGVPTPEPRHDAWASAASDEHARSVFRSQAQYAHPSLGDVTVAEPYALGRTTGEGGDVEVWLSRLLHQRFDPTAPAPALRRTMWARVEAASWRGDADAEKTWRERVTRLEAYIVDGRTVVLAHHAGL